MIRTSYCSAVVLTFLAITKHYFIIYLKIAFLAFSPFIMIGQMITDRKRSGREMGEVLGKVLESGFELGTDTHRAMVLYVAAHKAIGTIINIYI